MNNLKILEERLQARGFLILSTIVPAMEDEVPKSLHNEEAGFLVLVGNAGQEMFGHFQKEAWKIDNPLDHPLDNWTKQTLTPIAEEFAAKAVFPSDKPHLPFLRWSKKAGSDFPSALGMNIHPIYGLWHAYRAGFIFAKPLEGELDTKTEPLNNPCDTCIDKPCLSACPVSAFTPGNYNVSACASHLKSQEGQECFKGCLARRACPVGQEYHYSHEQANFHMGAFLRAR